MACKAEELEDIAIEVARKMRRRVTGLSAALLVNVGQHEGLTRPEKRVVSLLVQELVKGDFNLELAMQRPPEWINN